MRRDFISLLEVACMNVTAVSTLSRSQERVIRSSPSDGLRPPAAASQQTFEIHALAAAYKRETW